MKSRRKQLEVKAGALLFGIGLWLFHKRNVLAVERMGERFGELTFRVAKKRRTRALLNLEMAMPELSTSQREAIVHTMFRNFGRATADFLRSPLRSKSELLASVSAHGKERLDAALAQGHGVLIVSAHLGNWERLGHWFHSSGYKITVVARDTNDSEMNDRVNDIRRGTGMTVLSRGNAARAILTELKAGNLVAVMPDQNCDDDFVPFFGKMCGTVDGPVAIAERAKAPMLPVFCTYAGPGCYEVDIGEPLQPVEGFDRKEGLLRAMNNALEEAIRRTPDQWLWMHDRWKSARQRGLL